MRTNLKNKDNAQTYSIYLEYDEVRGYIVATRCYPKINGTTWLTDNHTEDKDIAVSAYNALVSNLENNGCIITFVNNDTPIPTIKTLTYEK